MNVQVTIQTRIFVCMRPLNFRAGLNATAAECRQQLNKNPLEGGLFVFINKSKTMIRLYSFDGFKEGMFTGRVAVGRFQWWNEDGPPNDIMIEHLHTLLRGGDPKKVSFPPPWRDIN